MSIYIRNKKNIKNIFANVNGEKKSITSAWVNKNGVPTKVFQKKDMMDDIVSWSDATDEQLFNLLNSHYKGEINLADYWHVGDERVVHLSAMPADSNLNNEFHEAQDIILVIIDFNKDILSSPINDINKAAITVHLKTCLNTTGIIDLSYANAYSSNQSFGASWDNCARREWCNNTFKNSLPNSLKQMIKSVKKNSGYIYYTYDNDHYTVNKNNIYDTFTNDSCFLLSPIEINHNISENDYDFIRYEYYINNSHRKEIRWWLRKPYFNSYDNAIPGWWDVSTSTISKCGSCFFVNSRGIAPAFCL